MSDAKQRNRDAFPNVAQIVDEFRRVFGAGVKLQHGVELSDGREVGVEPGYLKEATR